MEGCVRDMPILTRAFVCLKPKVSNVFIDFIHLDLMVPHDGSADGQYCISITTTEALALQSCTHFYSTHFNHTHTHTTTPFHSSPYPDQYCMYVGRVQAAPCHLKELIIAFLLFLSTHTTHYTLSIRYTKHWASHCTCPMLCIASQCRTLLL